ncbi:TPA: hypothetical protein N0F65_011567 [Lagenidium giganteum]|uniref:Kinesin motor domain-containing protein n=1 Tax=Lagenidium giganteum TaxID=4803 RepID=A0AAV2YLH8_9STRA|nr:TPA: hypothetical protein N0F65_011567 [Lagenidium giganteum]
MRRRQQRQRRMRRTSRESTRQSLRRGLPTMNERSSTRIVRKRSSPRLQNLQQREATGATERAASAGPRSASRLTMKLKTPMTVGLRGVAVPSGRRASLAPGSVGRPSQLPRRAAAATPEVTDSNDNANKENDKPASTGSFAAAFRGAFSAQQLEEVEALLKARAKSTKFFSKAKYDELLAHSRQLRGTLRTLCDQLVAFDETAAHIDQGMKSDRQALEKRAAAAEDRCQRAETAKLRLVEDLDKIQFEKYDLERRNKQMAAENEDLRAKETALGDQQHVLERRVRELEAQLQTLRNQNNELAFEIKTHQATMSDRAQMYAETKKELEKFYEKKDLEDVQRKNVEIERLQDKLSRVREEVAASNQEREGQRERANMLEQELKQERDRRTQLELEKCSLDAKKQSLEVRLSSTTEEIAEMKSKIKEKDEEMMKLVQNMTEIQKFTASSSGKLETEKKELLDKLEALQAANRELERKDANKDGTIRELQQQMERQTSLKMEAELKEKEALEKLKALETESQEHARQLNIQSGMREILDSQNRDLRNELVAAGAQLEAVKLDEKNWRANFEQIKSSLQAQIDEAENKLLSEREKFRKELDRMEEVKVSLESEVHTLRQGASSVQHGDLEELCEVKREADVLRLRLKELSNKEAMSLAQRDKLIEELQEKVRQGERIRRTMHNTIQELRGNVRVFARTRPYLPSDHAENADPVVSCEFDGQTLRLRRYGKSSASGGQPEIEWQPFSFDKVFPPSAGQDVVFDEVSEFVQSSMDGYHVCLFSYGQTGSGKTHTMQGSGHGQMRGIIPRAIEKVLFEAEKLQEHGWSYKVQASFLEIYNETLRDLLVGKEDADKKLSIKKEAKGGVYVPELTMVEVNSMDTVEVLMEKASRARSVACTDMNAQSSRSHSVFTLHLQGTNETEGIVLDGKLNLVDLAGSERASRSNVSGDRLRETQAINKSLSCLADVFTAIGNKSSHIPFRNSKLTYLLQTSLSGDGKTLMLVNLSPTPESANETLCSLRFAQQVNQCELEKKGGGKKGKEKKDDGAENGGVLTPEEQAKLFLSANRSLQMQLAERHEHAVKALEAKRELQGRVSDLQRDFERERLETFGITQDMTRQYKSMQEELLNRVNALENTNTELRDQLELARVNFEEMKREKDRVIAAKNLEIQELKAKMEEMAMEFGDMLKETLDKMRERIEITNTSFENEGGMPMIRRLEEFNLGSPTKN